MIKMKDDANKINYVQPWAACGKDKEYVID